MKRKPYKLNKLWDNTEFYEGDVCVGQFGDIDVWYETRNGDGKCKWYYFIFPNIGKVAWETAPHYGNLLMQTPDLVAVRYIVDPKQESSLCKPHPAWNIPDEVVSFIEAHANMIT